MQIAPIVSVNVGPVVLLGESRSGAQVLSGFRKHPITDGGAVFVGPEGLCDVNGARIDFQADERVIKGKRVHGGPLKAVYFYPWEHLRRAATLLGHDLNYGDMGENVTISGLTEERVHIGQRVRWGTALLEITGPRRFCFKFNLRHGEHAAEAMMATTWCGWYGKVLKTGLAPVTGSLQVFDPPAGSMTIADAFRRKVQQDPTVPGMPD